MRVLLRLDFPSRICDVGGSTISAAGRVSCSASDDGHLASEQAQGLFDLAISAERHSQSGIRRIACCRRHLGSAAIMQFA
jgi:hypothetical protein